MVITRDLINQYFSIVIDLPDGMILSKEGFVALAEWSERQAWWNDFVKFHRLEADWRASSMGDPYYFSISLFRFLRLRGYLCNFDWELIDCFTNSKDNGSIIMPGIHGKMSVMDIENKDLNICSTKVLIAYYSHSGNTREVASLIQKEIGGDIVEIIPVAPYPADFEEITKQVKQELKSGYKPALRTKIKNIESYDVIFVGSPNWWNTIAPPVKTFLSEYDLTEKATVPFITHTGFGLGRSVTDIAILCPQSTVLNGLAVWGRDARTSQNNISEWLRRLGLRK